MDIFVYGTLRYEPLRDVVLGRSVQVKADILPEHLVKSMNKGAYPTLLRGEGHANGLVLRDLTPADIACLDFYESGFGYTLTPATTKAGLSVQVYHPPAGQTPDGDWDLDDWVHTFGPLAVAAAPEVMSYRGKLSAQAMAAKMGQIQQRASSRLRARNLPKIPQPHAVDDVQVIDKTTAYSSFFTLEEVRLKVPQFNGSLGPQMMREVFVSGDGALVLPYDPVRDRVLVVEQFRAAPFVRDDQSPWMIEPVAGKVDPLETPEMTARREAEEEAGLTLHDLHKIPSGYATPGGSTDYFYLFCAIVDLPDSAAGFQGGMEGEAEDILTHLWSFDDLMHHIATERVRCTPLVAMAYWLALNRARLTKG